jgi:hypothetical protein
MDKEIRTKDGRILKVDNIMNYNDEKEYLASVGEDVYIKCPCGNYELLNPKKTGKENTDNSKKYFQG